jgi:quercetin dioxygenase-like cupin family protein
MDLSHRLPADEEVNADLTPGKGAIAVMPKGVEQAKGAGHSLYFPTPDECSRHTIFPGVTVATSSAEKMMLSVADQEPHAVVEEHSHPHEQVGIVLQGRAIFIIGGEQKTLGPGDLFRIPGNVVHKVIALDEPVKALDIFYPIREEYR